MSAVLTEDPGASGLPGGDAVTTFQLSNQQLRFWFLNQAVGEDDKNRILWGVKFSTHADRAAMNEAFNVVLERHALLRATFHEANSGEPQITIHHFLRPTIRWQDVTAVKIPVTMSALPEWMTAPFDLRSNVPFRVAGLCSPDGDYLIFLIHHILADERSTRAIVEELDLEYRGVRGATSSGSLSAPPSFQDIDARLRRSARDAVSDGGLDFWLEELKDAPLALNLPSSEQFSGELFPEAFRRSGEIPPALQIELERFCAQNSLTKPVVLLAIFSFILKQYVSDDEVVVGLPISLRIDPDESMSVGPLLNLIAVRCEISSKSSFIDLCRGIHTRFVRGLDFAHVPFDQVVKVVAPPRDFLRHPIFQATFSFHDLAHSESSREKELLAIETQSGTIGCDLSFTAEQYPDALRIYVDGAKGRVHSKLVERVLTQIPYLLHQCLEDPSIAIDKLSVTTPDQERDLIAKLSGASSSSFLASKRVVVSIMDAAQWRAEEDAIGGRFEMSYAELLAESKELAAELNARGVGPGAYVPIFISGDENPVVAQLGVLISGAAFVPIDVEWPDATIERVLADIGAEISIGHSTCKHGLVELPSRFERKAAPSRDLAVLQDPEDPMYAICTSGTTGAPKVASTPHRGIENRFAWMTDFFGPEIPVTLQTTPLIFDSSVWQVFWPLSLGGRCIFPEKWEILDPAALADVVAKQGVTVIDFVPSVLQVLLPDFEESPELRKKVSGVKWVIVGAENLPVETARRLRQIFPGARITNLYGPTEASIGCVFHEIVDTPLDRVPIGKPIPNVQVAIIDRGQRLSPRGAVGELMLMGACVGIGYLGTSDQRGFCRAPEAFRDRRAYRTGDLVRWDERGNLEYHGRIDTQIKIRGIRIELGAIQSIIEDHPGIASATLLVSKYEKAGSEELVAFVKAKPNESLEAVAILEWLSTRLPRHQCPERVEIVENFPLRPSGKLDTQALVQSLAAKQNLFPSTSGSPHEVRVLDAWRRVLRTTGEIGSNTNFFDAGGHSLMLLSLKRELVSEFSCSLGIVDLFRHPTIRAQAELIRLKAS